VADGLMSRASATANAGRDSADAAEKPEPTGQLGADEPLPEWERELLTSGGQGAEVAAGSVQNGAAAAPSAQASTS